MGENEMEKKLRWLLAGGTLSVSGTSLTIAALCIKGTKPQTGEAVQ